MKEEQTDPTVIKHYDNSSAISYSDLLDYKKKIISTTGIKKIGFDYFPSNSIYSDILEISIIEGSSLELSNDKLRKIIEEIRNIISIKDIFLFDENKSGIKKDGTILIHFHNSEYNKFQKIWNL